MLDKTYRARDVEPDIYARWQQADAFAPAAGDGRPFCLMMPPPNVTGSLHMGHALDQTIQDTLTRFSRMRGRPTLWQPGTDHAGIATQMMVERKLLAEGRDRRSIGREAFLAECWRWKEASQGNIKGQLERLGVSADWSRERFTMDEGLSRAVIRAFVQLYREGLIYRDKRLVNWDCALQTAISDLESEPREVDGFLWHFRYPLADDPDRHIVVATTRPETMLGDTGVAVHPEDERYRELVGREVILPLVGRRMPIIADTYSDPEKGTGAVKITPAHDFNDFAVGQRHGLETVSILDERGRINDEAPEAYRGLDRFEARQRVVADLEARGLLARIEPHRHMVPHGDRSGTPIEPFLTDQWYCDAATLARPAIEAVEQGHTVFVPEQWANTYFEWMRNIQPWCISRQLWWGHRIPAWYGPDGHIFVGESEDEVISTAVEHYGRPVTLEQDPDVLDTWFSSGLWPFSTLGWPEKTEALERFYPTSVLVTGFDIIFFWVARMMMQGLYFTGSVPFETVYIHGLVRDERGQKMSKTKGNVVDPLELIEAYGADALRYAILASTAQGRDIRFGRARVEGYRNFITKLWNAARFMALNEATTAADFEPARCEVTVNRWIVGETARAAGEVTTALEQYRFNDAALGLYHFVWNIFCDWYVELIKPLLEHPDEGTVRETRRCAAWVIEQVLRLLHPMAPFVSERLWHDLLSAPGGLLISAKWPELDVEALSDAAADRELRWLIAVVSAIRTARGEIEVPASARLELRLHGAEPATIERARRQATAIQRLARIAEISEGTGEIERPALQVVVDEATLVMPIAAFVDIDAEVQRLNKEVQKCDETIARIERKLADERFLERAPAEVVEEQRQRCQEAVARRKKLIAALERLS